MALDEAILAEVEARRLPAHACGSTAGRPPASAWAIASRPPTNSISTRVRARGYDVVVRPTGGRAVLHIDELTYSVIAPPDAEPWCATQAASYRTISQAVAQALDRRASASPWTAAIRWRSPRPCAP